MRIAERAGATLALEDVTLEKLLREFIYKSSSAFDYVLGLVKANPPTSQLTEKLWELAIDDLALDRLRSAQGMRFKLIVDYIGAQQFSGEQQERLRQTAQQYLRSATLKGLELYADMQKCVPFTLGDTDDIQDSMIQILANPKHEAWQLAFVPRIATALNVSVPPEKLEAIVREKPIPEQIACIKRFHGAVGYQPSAEQREALFRGAWEGKAYNGIAELMEITGEAPPRDIAQELIAASLKRETQIKIPVIDSIVRQLIGKQGYALADAQKEEMVANVEWPSERMLPDLNQLISYLQKPAKILERARSVYDTALPFPTEVQGRIVEEFERHVLRGSEINVAWHRKQSMYLINGIANLFTEPTVRQRAAEMAATAFADGKLYQTWVFANLTGVTPALTPIQYATLQEKIGKIGDPTCAEAHRSFSVNELNAFRTDIAKWKPEGA